jgi:5-methylthioribose kinase
MYVYTQHHQQRQRFKQNIYLNKKTKKKQALRSDVALKLAVGRLKAKFMDATEALLHGDLHTGSVMVKEGEGCESVCVYV